MGPTTDGSQPNDSRKKKSLITTVATEDKSMAENTSIERLARQRNKSVTRRNWYANLSEEKKQEYIQRTNDSRKRKRVITTSANEDTNLNIDKNMGPTIDGSQPNDSRKRKRVITTVATEDRSMAENTSMGRQQRRRTRWLLKALIAVHEYQGQALYEPTCSEIHILASKSSCEFCGAKRFEYEPPSFCCQKGEVTLADVEIPDELYSLFTSNSEEAKEFQRNIRAYNSIFSFTSFGVLLDKELASSKKGVFTFRAQGQIYHDLPALIPQENFPRYFQLYFYDTLHELQNRMRIVPNLNLSASVIEKIMHVMEGNPYAKFLRQFKDYPSFKDLQIHIKKDVKLDQRVYNEPTADQVATIWVEGNDPTIHLEIDIVVHAHSGNRHRVRHYYGCYDSLQYPILFPKGDIGWHQNILKKSSVEDRDVTEQNNQRRPNYTSATEIFEREQQDVDKEDPGKVSCRQYYCYKLQIKQPRQSILLYAKRLLQQFVVDMYIKLETTRLDFHRRKQNTIRAELYQGIVDSVTAGETRGDKIEKRIVLPASFIGGSRDMRRRYLDAIALVQRFGKPDLFLTMTCNPEWEEIQNELQEGQKAQDRPDLVSRVFRAKLHDLKDQLFKKEIFGKVAANVHVIEFQKMGLPHAHMLIILKPEYKIINPEDFDKYVCAELPDKNKHPELYKLVVKHMIHGPCGRRNPNNSCMVDGKCKYHYPRSYCEKTMCSQDGYPIYKRRKTNEKVLVRNKMLNNKWVVPYNPYLLTRYNCHINIEICSGIKAVKYLYKYIFKGHDKVAVYISHSDGENVIDEIQQFQDARWVSAQEAMWRIYEFNLNEMYPAVINLQLHLPGRQCVSYWEHQDLRNVLGLDNVSKTMPTEFFNFYSRNKKATPYLYAEFPEHYTWDNKNRCWKEREKKQVIGRINCANPIEGERYYLRLLLNHVRGPSSFEDLQTVNGKKCSSFKQAAQERGLLESDHSICECLKEAVAFQMPYALRRLFATILVYCQPSDVRALWDNYFEAMSDDFRRDGQNLETCVSRVLRNLNYFLESMGKCIQNFDLPKVPLESTESEAIHSREILDEMAVEIPCEDNGLEAKLNPEQQDAFTKIIQRVNSEKDGMFFIDGPGGTGKTFLYRALLAHVRSRKMIALATATSGVAAAILPGGRTAHSRFKIPITANETSHCNIPKQSGLAKLLKEAKLIVWDEAPMAKRFAIETLNRTLMDIMETEQEFGGKVIVLGGDFRQVLPIVPRGSREQTINASLVKSFLWPKMEKITLTRNMRARNDPFFSDFLLRVGNGEEPRNNEDMIHSPNEMLIKSENYEASEQELIDNIFPNLNENAKSAEYLTTRAILAARNETVDSLNEKLITVFPGCDRTFTSFDEVVDDNNNYYPEEFLNTLTPNGLPPHKLRLKENCPIMLLRNLDPSNGLCNGTRMVCRGFENNVIHAEITMGQHKGNQVFLPRIPLSPAENEGYPFEFRRKQFPIRLCFAMTINKAQGQTIPHVGVYLPHPIFSHGQLYVALSRGTSMLTTKVLIKNEHKHSRNVAYTRT